MCFFGITSNPAISVWYYHMPLFSNDETWVSEIARKARNCKSDKSAKMAQKGQKIAKKCKKKSVKSPKNSKECLLVQKSAK